MRLRLFRNYMQVLHFNSLFFYKKIDLEIVLHVMLCFCQTESLCNPGCREHMILWIIDVNPHTPEKHSRGKVLEHREMTLRTVSISLKDIHCSV